MNLPMRKGQISRRRSSTGQGTFTDSVAGGMPALMYATSAGLTRGLFSGVSKYFCQKMSQNIPRMPIERNAICQLVCVAIHTTTPETITPTLVPELNRPVASARSFCGNHMATALIEAGKLAASARPSTKRTIMKPATVATRPCAAAATDQRISAPASARFTPNLSTKKPISEGNMAYAQVKAVVIQP